MVGIVLRKRRPHDNVYLHVFNQIQIFLLSQVY